jgi:hypothetical protein
MAKQRLDVIVNAPDWRNVPPEIREKLFRRMFSRKAARSPAK